MTYTCVLCGRELEPSRKLNGKQRRAVCVCEPCVRSSIDPVELDQLLHPQISP